MTEQLLKQYPYIDGDTDRRREEGSFFFHEMMTHPVLFMHHLPEQVAIVGNSSGLLSEVIKHEKIKTITCVNSNKDQQQDTRVKYFVGTTQEWLRQQPENSLDVIIQNSCTEDFLGGYTRVLKENGMVVQMSAQSLLELKNIKLIFTNYQRQGFKEIQLLNFPQPGLADGWGICFLLHKNSDLKRIREKDIYNRSFSTRYYNLDTHKAALALPEFIRQEIEEF